MMELALDKSRANRHCLTICVIHLPLQTCSISWLQGLSGIIFKRFRFLKGLFCTTPHHLFSHTRSHATPTLWGPQLNDSAPARLARLGHAHTKALTRPPFRQLTF